MFLRLLNCFSLPSGLRINVHKSTLMGFGVQFLVVEDVTVSIGCVHSKSLFYYLGHIVSGNIYHIVSWDDMIRRFTSKLSNWKDKTLSVEVN